MDKGTLFLILLLTGLLIFTSIGLTGNAVVFTNLDGKSTLTPYYILGSITILTGATIFFFKRKEFKLLVRRR